MKKIISILIVTSMLLSLVPTTFALADSGDYPYPVIRGESTAEALIKYGNIFMKPGCDFAYVRGVVVPMPAPFYEGDALYFPLDDIAGFLSESVEYNSAKTSATWYFDHYEYIFDIGSTVMKKYELREETTDYIELGGKVKLGSDGKAYIPLEKLSEASGLRYDVTKDGIIIWGTREARYELKDFKESEVQYVKTLFDEGRDADKIEIAFYVDPVHGKDSNNGSVEYPFRTLDTAKQEVNNYKKTKGQNGNIVVYLREGNYTISAPITFTPEDSGENGYKIIYQAYPGEEVTIDGGERITGWEKVDDKIYRAYVGSTVSALFEGDHYSTIARHPNEGYHTAVAADGGPSTTSFKFRDGELPEIASTSGVRWYGWPGGPTGFYNWHFEDVPVSGIKYDTNTITIGGVAYVLGTGSRYYLAGAREFLDAPGEFWYSSADKYVYYYPVSEDINSANIIKAQANIFHIKGNSMNELAENLEFRGFNLRNTSADLVKCENAANVTIEDCTMKNAKGHAVFLAGKRRVAINLIGCDVQNIGGAGYSSGPNIQPDDNLSKWHVIKNNKIKNVGLTVPSSEAIELYGCGYSYIGHNHVSEGRNNGIMLKGGSGSGLILNSTYSSPKLVAAYTKDEFDENLILYYNPVCYNIVEYNEIDHFMWDSQDGGGIYTHSCGDENIVRNNYIHDVEANFSVCVGLYNDEESRDVKNYNNVVYNNQPNPEAGGSLDSTNQPWGLSFDGATYNNMFAENHRAGRQPNQVFYDSYDSAWEKNVAVNSGKTISNAKSKYNKWTGTDLGHNLYYNDETDNYTAVGGVLSERDIKTAYDYAWEQHSLFGVDPELMDKENGDLRPKYTSPVYRLGFRDINMANIGLTEEFSLVEGEIPAVMYTDILEHDTEGYVSLASGEYADVAVTLRDDEGYRVNGANITYTSDNPAVASVDNNGRITVLSSGVARVTVTASKGDKTLSLPVDVLVDDYIVSLNADLSLNPIRTGEHSIVRSWYRTKYGRYIPANDVTYSSSDSMVVSVDDKGFVTGLGEGKAQIVVSDGTFTGNVDIEVRESLFENVDIKQDINAIQVGEDKKIEIVITNEKGEEMIAPDESVSVVSTDEDILAIEKLSTTQYTLKPVKAGSAAVEVTVKLDGKTVKKTANIYVLSPDDEIDSEWQLANFGVNVDAAKTPVSGSFKAYKGGYFEFSSDGYDFWNKEDQGTMAYKTVKLDPANPVAEVKLKFNATSGDNFAKEVSTQNKSAFGVVIRSNDTAGSPGVHFRWEYGTGSVLYANREAQNADCGWLSGDTTDIEPELRIIYDAGVAEMYFRRNSQSNWVLFKSMQFKAEGDEIIIGLAGYSQNIGADGKPLFMTALGNVEVNVGADVDKSDTDYDIGNAVLN